VEEEVVERIMEEARAEQQKDSAFASVCETLVEVV
jgi:hypothetical protein